MCYKTRIHDRWHQNAVVYCVKVDVFRDGNSDFTGLTQGLAYLCK